MPDLDGYAREQLLLHQFMTDIPVAVSCERLATPGNWMKQWNEYDFLSLDKHIEVTAAVQTTEEIKEQISALTEQVAARHHNHHGKCHTALAATDSDTCNATAQITATVSTTITQDSSPGTASNQETTMWHPYRTTGTPESNRSRSPYGHHGHG